MQGELWTLVTQRMPSGFIEFHVLEVVERSCDPEHTVATESTAKCKEISVLSVSSVAD